jgi:methylmalonyl-CoA/ethylmalonyl-CoA epimerase
MAEREFGLGAIGQIAINVHDLGRAVAFYRDRLGMRFLFEVPNMAFFDCGGVRLMLGVATEPVFDHPASIVYYRVDDIGDAHAVLEERGVVFTTAPHHVADLGDRDLWLAFFEDPDANVLALMSEPLKTAPRAS